MGASIGEFIPGYGLCQRMASKASVNGAALASTNLVFENGITLATHCPAFAVISYVSGTLGIAVVELDADTTTISAAVALLNLTNTKNQSLPVIAAILTNDATKFLVAKVTTASAGASAFKITVYGYPY